MERRRGPPGRTDRPVPAQDFAGRAAAASQHLARGYEPGWPAAGAAVFRRPVRPHLPALFGPPPGAVRADRLGTDPRPAWGHLDRGPSPLRQLLHRELVAVD